jgi:hypothetical protein
MGDLGWGGIAFFAILHNSLSLMIEPVWIMPVAAGLAFGFRGAGEDSRIRDASGWSRHHHSSRAVR